MGLTLIALLSAAGLFVGMLILSEVGRRIGRVRLSHDPDGLTKGAAAAEAAVFGLLGLLIAFTFSGAASRFEARRQLVAQEANAIGTAYLRLDLLSADAQPEMRELFRRYLDSRLNTFRNEEDAVYTLARLDESANLQREIWAQALRVSPAPGASDHATQLLLPALNEMADVATLRTSASRDHPPGVVFLLLGGLSLIGAMLVGYGTSTNERRSWLHTLIFAAILSLTVYVIVDLEFPRRGLIRVDAVDESLIELRKSMQ